jgi:deoxycytidylate deaminase
MNQMNPCKRYDVYVVGVDMKGNAVRARNGNEGECKNIPGACGCIHAEDNLLKQMPHPVSVFLSHSPCIECAKLLVNAEVENVVYLNKYRITDGIELLKDNGIKVTHFVEDVEWERKLLTQES